MTTDAIARVHLMGLAGQAGQHAAGLLRRVGLAQQAVVGGHDGVRPDDPGVRMPGGHVAGFGFGQTFYVGGRIVRRNGGFVEGAGNDGKAQPRLLQQVFTPGGLGCQDQSGVGYAVGHRNS